MSKTKVKSDKYGFYVRGAGYIWRPVFPESYLEKFETNFALNDEVYINHGGGPLAKIYNKNNKEVWYSHGTYIKYQARGYYKSEECYKPKYYDWE